MKVDGSPRIDPAENVRSFDRGAVLRVPATHSPAAYKKNADVLIASAEQYGAAAEMNSFAAQSSPEVATQLFDVPFALIVDPHRNGLLAWNGFAWQERRLGV
jgi:hypothetical protein